MISKFRERYFEFWRKVEASCIIYLFLFYPAQVIINSKRLDDKMSDTDTLSL